MSFMDFVAGSNQMTSNDVDGSGSGAGPSFFSFLFSKFIFYILIYNIIKKYSFQGDVTKMVMWH
jgi:hypothetical protein